MRQHPLIRLAEALQSNQPAVLVTVIEVRGASPAKAGAQIVLLEDGTTTGTVGGGKLEAAILTDAKAVLKDGKPRLGHYALAEEGQDAIGTLCGGELRVFSNLICRRPAWSWSAGGILGNL